MPHADIPMENAFILSSSVCKACPPDAFGLGFSVRRRHMEEDGRE
jgi:hypothetical protein